MLQAVSVNWPPSHCILFSCGELAMNFSHRIDRLSFSDEELGAYALDGDIQLAAHSKWGDFWGRLMWPVGLGGLTLYTVVRLLSVDTEMFQYFIKVVPTTTYPLNGPPHRSNQYSVTEQVRSRRDGC